MKRILITGGAGFIGYHLTAHLAKDRNNQLVVVDNLQRGKMDDDFKELLKNLRIKFVNADLTEPAFYDNLKEEFDHVYHLAAVNGTKLFYEIPEKVLRTNTLSLILILDWVAKQKKKPKFCFTGSSEAYAGALEAFGKLLTIPAGAMEALSLSENYLLSTMQKPIIFLQSLSGLIIFMGQGQAMSM
jgi:UDP-glucose 4-epimerase